METTAISLSVRRKLLWKSQLHPTPTCMASLLFLALTMLQLLPWLLPLQGHSSPRVRQEPHLSQDLAIFNPQQVLGPPVQQVCPLSQNFFFFNLHITFSFIFRVIWNTIPASVCLLLIWAVNNATSVNSKCECVRMEFLSFWKSDNA